VTLAMLLIFSQWLNLAFILAGIVAVLIFVALNLRITYYEDSGNLQGLIVLHEIKLQKSKKTLGKSLHSLLHRLDAQRDVLEIIQQECSERGRSYDGDEDYENAKVILEEFEKKIEQDESSLKIVEIEREILRNFSDQIKGFNISCNDKLEKIFYEKITKPAKILSEIEVIKNNNEIDKAAIDCYYTEIFGQNLILELLMAQAEEFAPEKFSSKELNHSFFMKNN
jgi:hypothetical protein